MVRRAARCSGRYPNSLRRRLRGWEASWLPLIRQGMGAAAGALSSLSQDWWGCRAGWWSPAGGAAAPLLASRTPNGEAAAGSIFMDVRWWRGGR